MKKELTKEQEKNGFAEGSFKSSAELASPWGAEGAREGWPREAVVKQVCDEGSH